MLSEPEKNLLPKYLDELLKPKYGNYTNCKIKQIIDFVISDISKNNKKSKTDMAIIHRVCSLIENCVKKTDKIDKADLVVEIFKTIFGHMSDDEIYVLRTSVTFLCDSKLIKVIKPQKRAKNYVKKVIKGNLFF